MQPKLSQSLQVSDFKKKGKKKNGQPIYSTVGRFNEVSLSEAYVEAMGN